MKAPNTHRMSWVNFDRGTGKHSSGRASYPSYEAANRAKVEFLAIHPDAAACVTPIVYKPTPMASQKIGPSHPEWQGHRRMTP